MNSNIMCTVELMDPSNETHLRMAGVEAIVMRNELAGRFLATALRHPQLIQVVMELLTVEVGETIYRVPGPTKSTSYRDVMVDLKARDDVLVIGVQSAGGVMNVNPSNSMMVHPEDHLVVIGPVGKAARA
jgi:voltage-gated potassium channel